MIYKKQMIFVNKLLAAFSLIDCKSIDISVENVNKFMPFLKREVIDKKMVNPVDELNLLFLKNIYDEYFDFYKILDYIDPVIAIKDNDDLNLILNEVLAEFLLEEDENNFKREKMLEIASRMQMLMEKKDDGKVKKYAID